MQRRDLRMDEVAAVERVGNCSKTINLPSEFNGQAIAPAEIAIEIGDRTRLPLVGSAWTARLLQQRHGAYEHAILAAGNSAPGHLR